MICIDLCSIDSHLVLCHICSLPFTDIVVAKAMQAHLLKESNIYMLALEEKTSGMIYTRMSAQIYLEMTDFVKLGTLVAAYADSVAGRNNSQTTTLVVGAE